MGRALLCWPLSMRTIGSPTAVRASFGGPPGCLAGDATMRMEVPWLRSQVLFLLKLD